MSITYRPSLTLDEIKFLLDTVSWEHPDIHQYPLKRKLEVFTLKAQHGITKASHVRAGKQSDAAKLGFEEDSTIAALLEVYSTNPEALSVRQMAKVQFHRYTNDMMTPQEEAEYEADR
jgi:hypothetical protein